MTATELILARFAGLSPTLQQAAKFALDHPNEVVIGSMRTLAERAGAQPASFVRLAQALGLAGWPELKQAFAADLGLDTQGYGQRAKKLAGRGRDSALLGELFAVQRRNLDATEQHCGASLRGAAKILRRAGAVHVAGFRACFAIATSLVYGYRLFRPSVHLVDGLGGALEMQLRSVQPRDVVVVISFAPYSREALIVAQAARSAGAQLVALADSSAAPIALGADVVIPFAVASPSFFPSVAAGIAAVEALLEVLVAEAGGDVAERIARSEQQLFDSGAYLQPPPAKRRHG
ncbi:MAG TPA: MurR/RpiR family transcriptional regulator [Burkholderiaceae bacterium]|nr:MurR/RpiR family transcriptional regulator [Burkholderiaceae bacterium]